MSRKPFNWRLYSKMGAVGLLLSVGGPALVIYVTPSEEEIRKRYNPDLRKRSMETREQRQQDFDDFVCKLKEYSRSDKHIWQAAKEMQATEKQNKIQEEAKILEEINKRKEEMRKDGISLVPGGGL